MLFGSSSEKPPVSEKKRPFFKPTKLNKILAALWCGALLRKGPLCCTTTCSCFNDVENPDAQREKANEARWKYRSEQLQHRKERREQASQRRSDRQEAKRERFSDKRERRLSKREDRAEKRELRAERKSRRRSSRYSSSTNAPAPVSVAQAPAAPAAPAASVAPAAPAAPRAPAADRTLASDPEKTPAATTTSPGVVPTSEKALLAAPPIALPAEASPSESGSELVNTPSATVSPREASVVAASATETTTAPTAPSLGHRSTSSRRQAKLEKVTRRRDAKREHRAERKEAKDNRREERKAKKEARRSQA